MGIFLMWKSFLDSVIWCSLLKIDFKDHFNVSPGYISNSLLIFHKSVWIKLLCIILGHIKGILSFQITETKISEVMFITQFLSDSCLLSITTVSK